MNITIPSSLDRFALRAQPDGIDGRCTPSGVIDQAMNDLANQDPPREPIDVAALVAEAEASLARGEGRVWSPELEEEIWQRALENIRLGLPPAPHVIP